jgi:serine/threonine-protein kinase
VAYRSGDYDDAIAWYERAIAVAPDAAVGHNSLAAAFGMKGDFAAAAAALQKSIAIQPSGAAYTNLGTALFMDGRYRESVAAFEKAVEKQATEPLTWGNLADAYRWTPGSRERAQQAYQRAIQLLDEKLAAEPTNIRDRSRLALYLAKEGRHDRALSEVARVPDLGSRDVNTLYRAAVTHELTGNRTEALRWLAAALEKGYSARDAARDPELSNLRADIRYQRLVLRFSTAAGTARR